MHHSWPAWTCLSRSRRSSTLRTRAHSPLLLAVSRRELCCCKDICTPRVDPQVCFSCKLPQLDNWCAGNSCTKTKGCLFCTLCHRRESWLLVLQPYICRPLRVISWLWAQCAEIGLVHCMVHRMVHHCSATSAVCCFSAYLYTSQHADFRQLGAQSCNSCLGL